MGWCDALPSLYISYLGLCNLISLKLYFRFMRINAADLNPDMLVGKYIPNLIAKPFEVSREYAQIIRPHSRLVDSLAKLLSQSFVLIPLSLAMFAAEYNSLQHSEFHSSFFLDQSSWLQDILNTALSTSSLICVSLNAGVLAAILDPLKSLNLNLHLCLSLHVTSY